MSALDLVAGTLRAEFSDLLQVEQVTRVTARMTVALLLGAVIGWDRERRDADAVSVLYDELVVRTRSSAGKRSVNVEPLPCALATDTSGPGALPRIDPVEVR